MTAAQASESGPSRLVPSTLGGFTKAHLPGLDSLRGIAVLLILWTHVPAGLIGLTFDRLKGYLKPGYLGVDLFFVLSGFLITRILLVDRERGAPLRWFLLRRMLRIFPIYFLVVAVVAIARPGPEIPWCATYLSNFYFPFDAGESWLRHTWSLAVEEHFYLLWPFALYACTPQRGLRLLAGILIPGAILAAVGAAWLDGERGTRWLAVRFGADFADSYDAMELVYMGTPFRALSLSAGALFAHLETRIERHTGALRSIALCVGTLALMSMRLSVQQLDLRWYAVVRLIGFGLVSSAAVLWVIASHYHGTRNAQPERNGRGWLAVLLLLSLVHAALEWSVFHGMRQLPVGNSLLERSYGVLAVVAALLGLVACTRAFLRRVREKSRATMATGRRQTLFVVDALAAIVLGSGLWCGMYWRVELPALPEGVGTGAGFALPILAAVAWIVERLRAIDRPDTPLRRNVSHIAVFALAAVMSWVVYLRFAQWSDLAAVTRGQFALLAVLGGFLMCAESSALSAVGRISYGLYLYHHPLYFVFGVLPQQSPSSTLIHLAQAVAAAFLVAALSYRFLESPILQWGSRFRSTTSA